MMCNMLGTTLSGWLNDVRVDLFSAPSQTGPWTLLRDHFVPYGSAGSWDSAQVYIGTANNYDLDAGPLYFPYTGGDYPYWKNPTSNVYGAIGIFKITTVGSDGAAIENRSVTAVTTHSAIFNGLLTSTGSAAMAVCVLWGETTNAWANTNWWNGGNPDPTLTDNTPFSTNITIGILPGKIYYYTFAATNALTNNVVASAPVSFVTGELTVQATDPMGRTANEDPVVFTVYRPAACTNETLSVNYTLGGTAVQGADYSIAPASGTATFARGATHVAITVTPVYKADSQKSVVLALATGAYPIGARNSATSTLQSVAQAFVQATGGTVTNYTDAGGTNWTAHIFTMVGTTNLNVTAGGTVEYLVVGGGGGGGCWTGGGGGGGDVEVGSCNVVAPGNIQIVVGGGGPAGTNNFGGTQIKGANSSLGSITACGGGGGAGGHPTFPYKAASSGGSGGGGYSEASTTTGASAGSGSNVHKGGNGMVGSGGTNYNGGGGGGAGSAGSNAVTGKAGNGGNGYSLSISGTNIAYGGGGGGGAQGGGVVEGYGMDGGGNGGPDGGVGQAAASNRGGGGGGGGSGSGYGGAGGSGIVIVRYVMAMKPGGRRSSTLRP
ncbi:MAG: glycine-rich domain-containing protein [Kiritimatiellia bacterium]